MSGNGWYIDDTICDKSELLILLDGNRREYKARGGRQTTKTYGTVAKVNLASLQSFFTRSLFIRGETAQLARMAWFTELQLGSIVLFPHFAYYEKATNLDPSCSSRDLDKAS